MWATGNVYTQAHGRTHTHKCTSHQHWRIWTIALSRAIPDVTCATCLVVAGYLWRLPEQTLASNESSEAEGAVCGYYFQFCNTVQCSCDRDVAKRAPPSIVGVGGRQETPQHLAPEFKTLCSYPQGNSQSCPPLTRRKDSLLVGKSPAWTGPD